MSEYIELLKRLISTPSVSGEESATAAIIDGFLTGHGVKTERSGNNVWAFNSHSSVDRPTILLNSHHDTVRPNGGYTRNPFSPDIEDGKIYGLGSNDAGASVVSLIATFLHFCDHKDLTHNLCLAITAEEEISGTGGIESIIPKLGDLDFAIVGEPTCMEMAIAERGLMVLDCESYGRAGHAARDEGENAIYNAMKDIEWFRDYRFDKVSELFGQVKMSVTVINAGTQHNVVPDKCHFVVDVRVTDRYTNEEVLKIVRKNVACEVTPRSMRLRSSYIDPSHPIVRAGLELGRKTYGSPTTSDQALMNMPSVKMGPGDSARSHTADEFVYVKEIEEGITQYIAMLSAIISV